MRANPAPDLFNRWAGPALTGAHFSPRAERSPVMAYASPGARHRNVVAALVAAARGVDNITGVSMRVRWRGPVPDAVPGGPSAVIGEPTVPAGDAVPVGDAMPPPAVVHGPPLVLPEDAPATLTEA